MEEVAHKLQDMKKTYEELAEIQKNYFWIEIEDLKEKPKQIKSFRIEIEKVIEKLEQMKAKSARLKRKLGFLKAKKHTLGHQLDKDAPAIKKI